MDATYSTTPIDHATVAALWRLEKIILDTLDFQDVVQRIVESVLSELDYFQLGYRVIVLALVDEQKQILQRISYSRTKEGVQAIGSLSLPFTQIAIPLAEKKNICIQAMETGQPLITHSVADVFYPTLKEEEIAPIQERIGIKTTLVYPVFLRGKTTIGVLIFSLSKSESEVSQKEREMLAGFTDVVGIAVQNSLLYSSLDKAKQELEIANERLKSLDKLKDEFVSLASHELRTPLTAIKSFLWLLLRQGPDVGTLNEKQKRYMDMTYASTERLIKLVHDMLNVSRIESGRLIVHTKPIDLEQLARDVQTEVFPTAQPLSLTVTVVPAAPATPLVLADPDKIKEVLINLIGNSLKFTPPGGSITVSFAQQGDLIVTTISDTGKGIKQEDMPTLFQKFGMIEGNYTTTPITQGTGLGLYISKSIIELHGGRIEVRSEGENKGTSFSFSLPIAK